MSLPRHIRQAGLHLIERAVQKSAAFEMALPTLATLKAKKTKELNQPTTNIPKVVSFPST